MKRFEFNELCEKQAIYENAMKLLTILQCDSVIVTRRYDGELVVLHAVDPLVDAFDFELEE